jgi:hypothetical protein
MSNNEKAVEAAKIAEEALKKVREAEEALEAAKAEAKMATEEAKLAGKKETSEKEPLITDIEEISEEVVAEKVVATDGGENLASKKLILDFLQKKAWDLRKTIKGVVDVRFEDDPPRIVFAVVSSDVTIPRLEHNGVELKSELEIRAAVSANTVALGEDGSEDSSYHRSISGDGAKVLGITEAVGPHSASSKESQERKAYQAWLKRHPGVKRS